MKIILCRVCDLPLPERIAAYQLMLDDNDFYYESEPVDGSSDILEVSYSVRKHQLSIWHNHDSVSLCWDKTLAEVKFARDLLTKIPNMISTKADLFMRDLGFSNRVTDIPEVTRRTASLQMELASISDEPDEYGFYTIVTVGIENHAETTRAYYGHPFGMKQTGWYTNDNADRCGCHELEGHQWWVRRTFGFEID